MLLYLCRHGETDGNVNQIVQGAGVDMPLNEKGHEQAKELGKVLARLKLPKIYCSKMTRARQTAEDIAKEQTQKVEIISLDGVEEVHYGIAEGHPHDEVIKKYAKELAIINDADNPEFMDVHIPEGESIRDSLTRAYKAFDKVKAQGDDKAIIGGIATFEGMPVTVIGEQKGKKAKENMERNFGMPNPEGYRKALRLMKQAEKFNRPIITFIDTPGAYPGMGAEERGQGEAIARNLFEMSQLEVPIICIVIGEGSSGGALAIAVGDKIVMLENAIYSILSPEGFASILYKDASKAKEAAEDMKATAKDLKAFGVIDKVIKEPEGGAGEDFESVIKELKTYLKKSLKELNQVSKKKLVENRYDKFRTMC